MACAAFASAQAAAKPVRNSTGAAVPALQAEGVDAWVVQLRSRNRAVRGAAVEKLFQAGPAALPQILSHVYEQKTRDKLLRIIFDMGPKGGARLVELTDDPALGPAAADVLSSIAGPADAPLVPGLLACLIKHPALRDSCGLALARACSPKAAADVDALRRAAGHADPLVRVYALSALARIGPGAARALPEALKAAADSDRAARSAAARALGAFGRRTPEVLSALRALAADSDADVARFGKTALKALGGKAR